MRSTNNTCKTSDFGNYEECDVIETATLRVDHVSPSGTYADLTDPLIRVRLSQQYLLNECQCSWIARLAKPEDRFFPDHLVAVLARNFDQL